MKERNDPRWMLQDKFSHCFVGIMAFYLWAEANNVSLREVHLLAEHHKHKATDGRGFVDFIEKKRCLKKGEVMQFWVPALQAIEEIRGNNKSEPVKADEVLGEPFTTAQIEATVEEIAIPVAPLTPPPPAFKKKG